MSSYAGGELVLVLVLVLDLNLPSAFLKTGSRPLRIGTWKVKTLSQAVKLDNATYEMNNIKLGIL